MSRPDCISNRNIKIIATYVYSKIGTITGLLEGLPYPSELYRKPDDFFLNEDEWTTLENFRTIFLRARDLVLEDNFFYRCGFSTAKLSSWGKLHYFAKVFAGPADGFRRLEFFNKQFNDTKDIKVAIPPYYDKSLGLNRTIIIISYHHDMDPNEDVMGELYTRGIIASIPTLWNLPPAEIRLIMASYDPVEVSRKDPVEKGGEVSIEWEKDLLWEKMGDERVGLGEWVELIPEEQGGLFLGRYAKSMLGPGLGISKNYAFLLQKELNFKELTLFKNTLIRAPYFVYDITFERLSFPQRIQMLIPSRPRHEQVQKAMMETIDELRTTARERAHAYMELQKVNQMLIQIKNEQENIISQRTEELQRAKEELAKMNLRLKEEVSLQKKELERLNFLKRFLAPSVINYLTSKNVSEIPFQRKFISIIFVDIRGFTPISELSEPEDLMELLTSYFENIIKLIHQYQGTVYKILGDGIIVLLNDIIDIPDHALKAVKIALDIQCKVAEMKKVTQEELEVGIGINSGYVSLGTIGSHTFKDYAVIGKEMNLAARIQSLAGPGEILITHRTYSLVKEKIQVEERGKTQIKGIVRPVKLYKVLGLSELAVPTGLEPVSSP